MIPAAFLSFLLAAALAFVLCWSLGWIAPKIRLMDAPDRLRKSHARPVPLVGGLAVWISVNICAALLHVPLFSDWWWGVSLMGFVGLLDDWLELSPKGKLMLQIAAALALAYYLDPVSLKVPAQISPHQQYFLIFLFVIWILLITNSINYIDNCNGCCAGTTMMILIGIYFIEELPYGFGSAFHKESSFDFNHPSDLMTMAAALIGFLFLNFPKGKVFLGDSGSHLLGCIVATRSIKPLADWSSHHEFGVLTGVFTTFLLVSIPLIDFVQVTLGRLRRGQPIWEGDAHHLSHLLIRKGFSPRQAAVFLWAATAISIAGALAIWNGVTLF